MSGFEPVRYLDPFNPVLLGRDSKTFDPSIEQQNLIKHILSYACSDSRFAQKAYSAIMQVLTQEQPMADSIEWIPAVKTHVGSPVPPDQLMSRDEIRQQEREREEEK